MLTLALLALLQQPAVAQDAGLPPSPIARIEVQPARGTEVIVTAQDTVRLTARAFGRDGAVVSDVGFTFFQGGSGRFEGVVTPEGLVRSGATGTIAVNVIGRLPGTRPFVQSITVKMVPGPAHRIALAPVTDRLVVGQRLHLTAEVFSAAGDLRPDDEVSWLGPLNGAVEFTGSGHVVAMKPGTATISAVAGDAKAERTITVVPNTIATVEVVPAGREARQGDVVRFRAVARDAARRELEGLTPTWSFSPGEGRIDPDGAFVGYAARPYTITASFGTRSADAVISLAPRDVRRPATVVGRLPRTQFTTEEVWIHPNGQVAYLGTGSGGDRMYAVDITDPSAPMVTDSIVVNTRRVNDLMTTPDGRTLVFTREGASDRKNGIVIASLDDPRHPKPIAEFTDGMEAGVHSAFIYHQAPFGTHVFATNDGTGAIHVINIDDPAKPREVARWRTDRPDDGRTLHDVDVQDGLAYLSYWNDGLVILDVGNGIKGGAPSNPQLVTQVKYDLNALYRDVEATGGPGFIRGTHTAWRHKDYVFIADEVFPASPVEGAKDASAGRAYGRLQVVDVSDLTAPKIVAHYEPEFGGVHNLWVAGDTLYMGAYNAGFRAFDISGELRGDLRAQGREMAHVHTADMDGSVKNAAMTWGVVVRDGLAYVNDMYNGLWIVRLEPRRRDLTP
jgi:hypothetical protein